MDSNLFQRINEETDIVALASEFIKLEKKGKNYMGLCPFHAEKTPSFSVSPEKGLAKCMGCGEGGNAITFYRKIKNISFEEAVADLAERLGIDVPQFKAKKDPQAHLYQMMQDAQKFFEFVLDNSEGSKDALDYLKKRNLTHDDLRHFGIGYAPAQKDALYQMLLSKNYYVSDMIHLGLVKQAPDGGYYDLFSGRITFPITNHKGQVVGFSARTLSKSVQNKYMNSPETKIFKKGELIYHAYESIRDITQQKHVVLYEGFFDVIASYRANMKHAVATMGTALTKQHAAYIKRLTKHVIIAFDGDRAGVEAALKAIISLRKENLKIEVLLIPKNLDPDDFVNKYGVDAYQALFKTNLQDAYQFAYTHFKSGKDFKNANDIMQFKRDIQSFFAESDTTIKRLYQQRIADELNISISLDHVYKTSAIEPKLPAKLKPTINRAEQAVKHILINLLLSKKYLNYIKDHLNETVDVNHFKLYKGIQNYYQLHDDHDHVDINLFVQSYEEVKEHLEINYLKDIHYTKRITFQNLDVIDKNLMAIKELELYIELEKLKKELQSTNDMTKQEGISNEIVTIQNQLKKRS